MKDLLSQYDAEADRLLEEAERLAEEWGESKTRILMRVIAARLQRQEGIPHQEALKLNKVITQAMRVGYLVGAGSADAQKDEPLFELEIPKGVIFSNRIIQAA